ncbi:MULTISPECIES: S24 family peptidase [unclassified Gemella]|uniref:S24 family peptidase n=1 Tax=unclassified Gemella TaxID=2624949 RepID=UPI00207B8653|nr:MULTISPECIES: S24 family peptidase [unclassified Gemella]
MKTSNIKQVELVRLTNITLSSISDWLKGKYLPKQDKINKIADCLNVDAMWLLGYSDENFNNKTNYYEVADDDIYNNISKIPLIGTICSGDGVYAEENLEDYMYVDQATRAEFVALRVKGDSMIDAGIFDGDIVFIKNKTM